MNEFILCFIPLFVAVDPMGILPIFMSLVEGLDRKTVKKIILQSVLTAAIIAVMFLALGKLIFRLLGITVADFLVAGGILLFVISISDLLSSGKKQREVDPDGLGFVPLGVPLLAGPAMLTTIVILVGEHGYFNTVAAALINILIAGGVFWVSGVVNRLLGKSGARAISKIANLFLAAIAVMMVRKGVMAFLPH
jgi:multiple antibiotic resistance protein